MARVDPPPVHPCKTQNDPKNVNDLLDLRLLGQRRPPKGGGGHLDAMGLTAPSRSIEGAGDSRAGRSNDHPSREVRSEVALLFAHSSPRQVSIFVPSIPAKPKTTPKNSYLSAVGRYNLRRVGHRRPPLHAAAPRRRWIDCL